MVTNLKPIRGYESRYLVSDTGAVLSLRTGKELKPDVTRDGHLQVALYGEEGRRVHKVHRLVAIAFLDNPGNLPSVLHWDDDPSNNYVGNLRWGSSSDNSNDSVRNGTHRNSRKTHCAQGHPYDKENTYQHPIYGRRCRACDRGRKRRSK